MAALKEPAARAFCAAKFERAQIGSGGDVETNFAELRTLF